MIERFYFVKLADDAVPDRAAIAQHVRDVLGGVASVGVPADDSAARWDLSIVIRTPDLDAYRVFAATPAIAEMFATYLMPRAAVIKAWTFDAT